MFKSPGPRERVACQNGVRVIVEELSYYNHGEKVFGKIFKPGDENGNFPDSLGSRPLVIFFHSPLNSANPEKILREISSKGVVGYSACFHGLSSEITFLLRKLTRERFVSRDLVFLVSDGVADGACACVASKRRNGVTAHLTVNAGDPASGIACIEEFLELNGALK